MNREMVDSLPLTIKEIRPVGTLLDQAMHLRDEHGPAFQNGLQYLCEKADGKRLWCHIKWDIPAQKQRALDIVRATFAVIEAVSYVSISMGWSSPMPTTPDPDFRPSLAENRTQVLIVAEVGKGLATVIMYDKDGKVVGDGPVPFSGIMAELMDSDINPNPYGVKMPRIYKMPVNRKKGH